MDQPSEYQQKQYDELVYGLGAIALQAAVEFGLTHQLSLAELSEYNRTRLNDLGPWIQQRLAALPKAEPANPPAGDDAR